MARTRLGRLHFATVTAVCAFAGVAAAQDMPASPNPALPPASPAPASPQPASPNPTNPAQQAEVTPPALPQPGPPAPAANPLSQAQLQQIVAPIALYPDPLLSQVLMASTYPLEIVEAARWARMPANEALKGDALTGALKQQNWDPSVMALVPFPKLLTMMADKLEWTQALGNAFLAQQADVMNAVQALRHDAMAAGNLKVTPQCHCVIQTSGDIISIMPSDTNLVCIPVYNPRVVYGSWRWADYPPDYFPIPPDFAFEPGYAVGFWPVIELAAYGPLWGWGSFDWGHGEIGIDRARYAALDPHPSFSGSTWVHDPAHRGGVGYGDPAVTARFGATRVAAVTAAGHAAFAAGRLGGRTTATGGSAAPGAHFAGAGRFGGPGHEAAFARGPGHVASAYHGPVGRGPAPVHGGGGHPIARAQFHAGGGPHFAAPHGGGGGPHGGGGGPHGGGGHHR